MFDLKYYEMLSKSKKYFDENKGNVMSRQYIHKISLYKNGKSPNIFMNRINELPDIDPIKDKLKELYVKKVRME